LDLPPGTDVARATAILAGLPHVRDLRVTGRALSARSDDGAAAVPGILTALERAGVPVAAVTVARPSLDDVYLRHTGRRYATEETKS
jgi:ABC-2 type transport system ATP-binding protein